MKNKDKVIIEISGGVASLKGKPADVHVEIWDYDEKKEGTKYWKQVFKKEKKEYEFLYSIKGTEWGGLMPAENWVQAVRAIKEVFLQEKGMKVKTKDIKFKSKEAT